jgi:hypothetical protein
MPVSGRKETVVGFCHFRFLIEGLMLVIVIIGEILNHSSLLLGDIEALYIYEIQIDKRFHRKVRGLFARCQSCLL